jgi:DNA-binding CsgD family transcriptional regulator
VAGRFRVFLIGVASSDLETLRARSAADRIEIAGSARLHEIEDGTVSLPASIDAFLVSPAAWRAARADVRVPGRRSAFFESARERDRLIEDLTPRERDVLALVAEGRANRDIAARLGVSEHTVKFHLASVFGKLGVTTRTQAVRRAIEWGLIEI